jgi:hypothetical protein
LLPNCGPLPQISQTCAIGAPDDCQAGWVNMDYSGFRPNSAT